MDRIPFIYRAISDTVTITALVMIALFALLDRLGTKKDLRDPLMVYFAIFSFSLACYVFFDNALSLLLFHGLVIARVNTIGVASCAFGLMISYSGMITQVFDLPRRKRRWFQLCVILAVISWLLSTMVFIYGWEWYMEYLDAPAITLYGIIFVIIEAHIFITIRSRPSSQTRYNRITRLLMISLHIMILSLFFWRVLINISYSYFFFNNSLILGAMAFLFPVVFALHRSDEYRELQALRLEQKVRSRLATQSLRELFRSQKNDIVLPTERETEVCEALLEGLEYKEIQDRTGLSMSGVKKRVHLLYRKLNVQNRTELYNRIQEIRSSAQVAVFQPDLH